MQGSNFSMLAFILILFLQINSFESSAGVQKSVADYFREAYKLEMHYDFLPCLQVGSDQRPNYLPMEVTDYGLELWPMLQHSFPSILSALVS